MDRLGDAIRRELGRFGGHASLAELLDRWPAAVGEAIARNAWPLRIGRDGTLHVAAADSIWAFELGQRGTEIAARLGVPRVRFAPGPLPAQTAEAPRAAAPRPSEGDRRRAAELAAPIGDEKLRKAVQSAVVLGLARAASDRAV